MEKFVKQMKFNKGLIPVIIQDYKNKEVLMLGYMNKEAFKKSIETGKVHFFSRSRNKLWLKGNTSGHFQIIKEIYFDCDIDTLLIKVFQVKGACHNGYISCFYRQLFQNGSSKIVKKKI